MSPIEPVSPTVPGNWVRRVEEKRRKDNGPRRRPDQEPQNNEQKPPPGQDPDGRTHIIDDLA